MKKSEFKKIIKRIIPQPFLRGFRKIKDSLVRPIPHFNIYQEAVKDKLGLEIGGPSSLFKLQLPIYPLVKNLDGLNFSSSTLWEGNIQKGLSFNYYKNRNGQQFISEATSLLEIKNDSYDFVASSNCLEHVANPLKALFEWKRVLKMNGYLILILPKKESNFDRKRSDTPFEHFLDDYNKDVDEKDLTHLDEILQTHDLDLDPLAGNFENFKLRSQQNLTYRGLHHHVFNQKTIQQSLDFCGFVTRDFSVTEQDYIVLAQKFIH